jgi:hypothetical protein
MQAAELTAEFGIAGILDFVETEHGLVKATMCWKAACARPATECG